MELVNPKKLNKPGNVNRFKEGLEKLWTLNLLLLVKRSVAAASATSKAENASRHLQPPFDKQ